MRFPSRLTYSSDEFRVLLLLACAACGAPDELTVMSGAHDAEPGGLDREVPEVVVEDTLLELELDREASFAELRIEGAFVGHERLQIVEASARLVGAADDAEPSFELAMKLDELELDSVTSGAPRRVSARISAKGSLAAAESCERCERAFDGTLSATLEASILTDHANVSARPIALEDWPVRIELEGTLGASAAIDAGDERVALTLEPWLVLSSPRAHLVGRLVARR